MASNSRTLTLALAADIDGLKKGLDDANKVVDNSATQIAEFGKKAALAFAAVGAAATAFAVSAVKAAAEDEKSRKLLEQTIRSNTKATEEQIASIDKYITKQSIATATTDDVLRPALSRLVRSTKDVTEAQKLLDLAQNISLSTGKPLEAIANALGRAYDGNVTALGKLGIQTKQNITITKDNSAAVDAAEKAQLNYDLALKKYGATADQTVKASLALSQAQDKIGQSTSSTKSVVKDFDTIVGDLQKTFGGFVENEATNAEFKFRQLTIALDETKEQIGVALLPIVKEFADYLLATVVPNVQALAAGLTGDSSVTAGINDATKGAYAFGQQLRSTIEFVISIKDELLILGGIIATVFVANKIIAFVAAIQTLITAMVALRAAATAASVATAFATGGGSIAAGAVALAAAGIATGVVSSAVSGGNAANAASTATAGQLATGAARAGTTVNNITVQSVDAEGSARAVAKVLNNSASRSTPQLYNGGITRSR
jgi:hypothetical protein